MTIKLSVKIVQILDLKASIKIDICVKKFKKTTLNLSLHPPCLRQGSNSIINRGNCPFEGTLMGSLSYKNKYAQILLNHLFVKSVLFIPPTG